MPKSFDCEIFYWSGVRIRVYMHKGLRWHNSITLVLSMSKKVVSRTKRIGQGVRSAYKKILSFICFNILFVVLFAKTKNKHSKKGCPDQEMNEIIDWCSIFTRKAKVNNKSNILSLVWKPLPLSLRESPASEINLTLGSNFTRLELGFKKSYGVLSHNIFPAFFKL